MPNKRQKHEITNILLKIFMTIVISVFALFYAVIAFALTNGFDFFPAGENTISKYLDNNGFKDYEISKSSYRKRLASGGISEDYPDNAEYWVVTVPGADGDPLEFNVMDYQSFSIDWFIPSTYRVRRDDYEMRALKQALEKSGSNAQLEQRLVDYNSDYIDDYQVIDCTFYDRESINTGYEALAGLKEYYDDLNLYTTYDVSVNYLYQTSEYSAHWGLGSLDRLDDGLIETMENKHIRIYAIDGRADELEEYSEEEIEAAIDEECNIVK